MRLSSIDTIEMNGSLTQASHGITVSACCRFHTAALPNVRIHECGHKCERLNRPIPILEPRAPGFTERGSTQRRRPWPNRFIWPLRYQNVVEYASIQDARRKEQNKRSTCPQVKMKTSARARRR